VVHRKGNPMSNTDVRAAILDRGSLFQEHLNGERRLEHVPFSISIISGRMWRCGGEGKGEEKKNKKERFCPTFFFF